ncbi:MAG: 2-amino-4-hydroxy-6-hydroxymethyldihydropteridine diphosphokinase [bacterium]|nr:2-amino-4-hydroxy-6-hydroxymethyldihydropteridine diphosphokinase [bacterium]
MNETAYIGLGSNIGDRERHLAEAVRRIGAVGGVRVRRTSSLYDTEPVGGPPQPPFLNAAVEVETAMRPERLLAALRSIEEAMGRVRGERDGPRVIDLDILLFGDRVAGSESLTVPHPRLLERRFALEPLAEIAPGAVHPVAKRTAAELLEMLGAGRAGAVVRRRARAARHGDTDGEWGAGPASCGPKEGNAR